MNHEQGEKMNRAYFPHNPGFCGEYATYCTLKVIILVKVQYVAYHIKV